MSRLFAEELPGPARSLHPGHASAGASCASPAAGIATPGTTAMPPTGRTLQPMPQTERDWPTNTERRIGSGGMSLFLQYKLVCIS